MATIHSTLFCLVLFRAKSISIVLSISSAAAAFVSMLIVYLSETIHYIKPVGC